MRNGFALFAVALLLAGCAHKKHARIPPPPAAPRAPAAAPQIGSTETGIASWYGYPYHGRPAADGEIYDMEQLTAAHRTLPFQTWVRVFNLDNSKTVDVRITDRGPFIDGRIIDISRAAARTIDMVGPGTPSVSAPIWPRATVPRAWCYATGILRCGACWWAPRLPKMAPTAFRIAFAKNLMRKTRSWCD